MSNKNDTFNIDDLLNMPNLANEFDKTNELKFSNNIENEEISNKEISIDSLLNTNNFANQETPELINIENSTNKQQINLTPPPPPPIIKKEEKNLESKINIEEPSITSAIDLNDFIINNDNNNYLDDVDDKISEMIDHQTMNDYYKNIEEEQDIKKTSQETRIYFDDDLEQHLKTHNINKDFDNYQEKEINDYRIVNEEAPIKKENYFRKIINKNKDFKENLSNVTQYYKFEYRYSKIT